MLLIYDYGCSVGCIVVDGSHRVVWSVHTAVGAVVGVDAASEAGAPRGVVDSAASAERHPVIDGRSVAGTREHGVGRALIHTEIALGSIVDILGARYYGSVNDQLAVLEEPHTLL